MLETFTVETFTPLLHTAFRVADAAESLALDLVEITPLGGAGMQRPPFALLFRGPRDRFLPQRTYPLEHDTLGAFDLFLVPLGPDSEGIRYEAIFT